MKLQNNHTASISLPGFGNELPPGSTGLNGAFTGPAPVIEVEDELGVVLLANAGFKNMVKAGLITILEDGPAKKLVEKSNK